MMNYDDMMREVPEDIMSDIHAYYHRYLPYLDELNVANEALSEYEVLVTDLDKGLLSQKVWDEWLKDKLYQTLFVTKEDDANLARYCHYVSRIYGQMVGRTRIPKTLAKLILNRDCGHYKYADKNLLDIIECGPVYRERLSLRARKARLIRDYQKTPLKSKL